MNTLILSAALAASGFASLATAAGEWESSVRIRATAGEYVARQTPDGAEVLVGALDERLRLPSCENPLEALPTSGNLLRGAVNIGVRCLGSASWTVYVPVRIQHRLQVVVLARPLARGATITADALRLQEQDSTTLPYGYFTTPEQAIGKILRRSVVSGHALTPDALEAPLEIRHGQLVTLLGRAGTVEVRSSGKALGNAARGERVRVENTGSHRIVEGVARDGGLVEVNL